MPLTRSPLRGAAAGLCTRPCHARPLTHTRGVSVPQRAENRETVSTGGFHVGHEVCRSLFIKSESPLHHRFILSRREQFEALGA